MVREYREKYLPRTSGATTPNGKREWLDGYGGPHRTSNFSENRGWLANIAEITCRRISRRGCENRGFSDIDAKVADHKWMTGDWGANAPDTNCLSGGFRDEHRININV